MPPWQNRPLPPHLDIGKPNGSIQDERATTSTSTSRSQPEVLKTTLPGNIFEKIGNGLPARPSFLPISSRDERSFETIEHGPSSQASGSRSIKNPSSVPIIIPQHKKISQSQRGVLNSSEQFIPSANVTNTNGHAVTGQDIPTSQSSYSNGNENHTSTSSGRQSGLAESVERKRGRKHSEYVPSFIPSLDDIDQATSTTGTGLGLTKINIPATRASTISISLKSATSSKSFPRGSTPPNSSRSTKFSFHASPVMKSKQTIASDRSPRSIAGSLPAGRDIDIPPPRRGHRRSPSEDSFYDGRGYRSPPRQRRRGYEDSLDRERGANGRRDSFREGDTRRNRYSPSPSPRRRYRDSSFSPDPNRYRPRSRSRSRNRDRHMEWEKKRRKSTDTRENRYLSESNWSDDEDRIMRDMKRDRRSIRSRSRSISRSRRDSEREHVEQKSESRFAEKLQPVKISHGKGNDETNAELVEQPPDFHFRRDLNDLRRQRDTLVRPRSSGSEHDNETPPKEGHTVLPPPSVVHRQIGRGNYLVLVDPQLDKEDRKLNPRKYKNKPVLTKIVRRYDGQLENGKEVEVKDARLRIPQEKRIQGSGSKRNRKDGLVPVPSYVSKPIVAPSAICVNGLMYT
jgi:hypothetical protein